MVNRREFLGTTFGAGATLAITPELLRALQALEQQGGPLIQRAIPSTGELLPVIGLSFSNHAACADPAALKEVLKTFADNGGRVFDAMHGSASSEQFHATVANALGIQNKLFWSTRGTSPDGSGGAPQPGAAAVKAHVEMWKAKLKASRMDLVMVPPQGDPTWLAGLKEMKKEGHVRYIGVQVIGDNVYPQLESVMRNEVIDFIGVDYDVGNRARVEDTILPLAQDRKIGVLAYFPFGGANGLSCAGGMGLFARVANTPLPEWAAEFDAKTWAQFFLKYVISHPAVTVARVGTTKATHMLDNIGGGIGRLPNEATRRRMAAFIDALPPVTLGGGSPAQVFQGPAGAVVLPAAILDRYVGEYKTAAGIILTFRRYGTMLTAKPGANSETVIYAHSDTRFSLGSDVIEFRLDSAGTVTGLVLEQGSQNIPASRIR
jgi:aryl-alcohol dehydrogenase-like predicted oxidoreductase